MPASLEEWEDRHRLSAGSSPAEPASIARELLPLLPIGPALDLACGTGRHTLLFAGLGHSVTAVDWSPVALDILEIRAREARLPVRRASAKKIEGPRSSAGIQLVEADLETVLLPQESFAVILCIQYLQRSRFPAWIWSSIASFARGRESPAFSRRSHCVTPGIHDDTPSTSDVSPVCNPL